MRQFVSSNRNIATTTTLAIVAILCLLCPSCQRGTRQLSSCRHDAGYLRIVDTLGYQQVDILSPWAEGALLSRIYLVKDDTVETPTDAPRLRVPVERLAVSTATQMGFLHALDAQDGIVAMCTPHLIYNAPARTMADGTERNITNIGEDFNLNVEALLLAEPQLLLMTNYGAPLTQVDRVRDAGIAVLELVEWMEQDPIGRAGWIRLYGALTCREAMADSILGVVTEAYQGALQASEMDGGNDVQLATGQSFRGTWYVPSGQSYMGRLIHDAGARYVYSSDTTKGSIPLTLEQALTAFGDADVWIGVNASSMEELKALDEKHTWMKAYQNRRVYDFARRTTGSGGNDFWEGGTVHPEYILNDIRWAMDSTRMGDYEPHFIRRL